MSERPAFLNSAAKADGAGRRPAGPAGGTFRPAPAFRGDTNYIIDGSSVTKDNVALTGTEQRALLLSPNYSFGDRETRIWRRVPATAPYGRAAWRELGLWPAVVLAIFALMAVMALEVFAVNPRLPAAIVFPKGVALNEAFLAIVAAGGLPVRPTHSVFSDDVVWIAVADNPNFFSTVRAHGALAVINPVAFGGCLLVSAQ
jgi:hypothetical protein